MYVRTSVSNAVASPARTRAMSAPSRSAAATRSGECDGSAGTLALTESVTFGRARDSAQRRAACGIPDLPSAPASLLDLTRTLELLLGRLLGALPRALLELRGAIALLGSEHGHHLIARLGERRRERVDHGDLRLAQAEELLALFRAEVVDAAGGTPGRLQRVDLLEHRRRRGVELALDQDDLRALTIGERHVLLVLDDRARHVHGRD